MSLLSEQVATVTSSPNVIVTDSLVLPLEATTFLNLSNGAFQQAVGFVEVRDQEWTPVLDITSGEPLELPQGYVPSGFYARALEYVPNDANLQLLTIDSIVDPPTATSVAVFNVNPYELNAGLYYRVALNTSGVDYNGRNYLIFKNLLYPAPVATGALQVIVTYF